MYYPRIDETVTFRRLKNGLPAYVVHKPGYTRKYAMFATRYGGMDLRFQQDGAWQDTPAGIAHYLEHKMFDTADGNASGYDKETAFFDCIYVQDETGGINCFPVAGDFKIGDRVRVSGTTHLHAF